MNLTDDGWLNVGDLDFRFKEGSDPQIMSVRGNGDRNRNAYVTYRRCEPRDEQLLNQDGLSLSALRNKENDIREAIRKSLTNAPSQSVVDAILIEQQGNERNWQKSCKLSLPAGKSSAYADQYDLQKCLVDNLQNWHEEVGRRLAKVIPAEEAGQNQPNQF